MMKRNTYLYLCLLIAMTLFSCNSVNKVLSPKVLLGIASAVLPNMYINTVNVPMASKDGYVEFTSGDGSIFGVIKRAIE